MFVTGKRKAIAREAQIRELEKLCDENCMALARQIARRSHQSVFVARAMLDQRADEILSRLKSDLHQHG